MKSIVEYASQLEKPYIDAKIGATQSIIAPREASSTASAAYAVDDQLILNDILYKVTAPIAIGDTITVGTNVAVADKIVDQISSGGSGTIDPSPTQGSTNAVQSGGVYTALQGKAGTIQLNTTGTASATTPSYQRLVVDGTPVGTVTGSTYLEQSVALSTSADVTVTFTNSAITANSAVDVYTTIPTLTYKDMNISAGSCTVTFGQQESAETITVRIYIK